MCRADARGPGTASLLVLAMVAFGGAAVLLGQSNNWDLRNYHWYNGWAWLNDRHTLDFAAAQAQTWFNPLLPAFLYSLLSSLTPWLGTFLLGALQGINLVPLHHIARRLLPQRPILVLLVAIAGATGATQRGELGATFGDNLVSIPLLCALAFVVRPAASVRTSALAGALLGLAVGLKLTAAPAAASIACASVWLFLRRGEARHGVVLAGSAIVAFLVINGPWMWHLWRSFGNPLFPMFSAFFGSEFALPIELRDTRWLARDLLQWLFYPLCWASQPRIVSELWFLDLRVPAWFVAMVALPVWWRRAHAGSIAPQALTLVIVATALTYGLWLVLFGYYRYLIVVEMLAPLLVTVALLALPVRIGIASACIVLVAIGLGTRAPRWGRLDAYADSYVTVQLPGLALQRDAIVVLAGDAPLAFLAPSFPSGTRFVRIQGNVMGPPLPESALDRTVAARIRAHRGPLLLLCANPDDALLPQTLQRHALTLNRPRCAPVQSNLLDTPSQRPVLCPLAAVTAAQ